MLPIDRPARLSVSGVQLVPPLAVDQIPPLVAPTSMRLALPGSIRIVWIAPDVVCGAVALSLPSPNTGPGPWSVSLPAMMVCAAPGDDDHASPAATSNPTSDRP